MPWWACRSLWDDLDAAALSKHVDIKIEEIPVAFATSFFGFIVSNLLVRHGGEAS